jgi:chemotaxis signal transduction protein
MNRRALAPEAVRQLLRERAQRVARKLGEEVQVEPYALFERAGQLFGVPQPCARACWSSEALFEVPGAPRWISGAASGDGLLVSVVDLAALYELPRAGARDLDAVLVVEAGGRMVGVACEAMLGMRELEVDLIRSSPEPRGALLRRASFGVQTVQLIDVEALFADERLNGKGA